MENEYEEVNNVSRDAAESQSDSSTLSNSLESGLTVGDADSKKLVSKPNLLFVLLLPLRRKR